MEITNIAGLGRTVGGPAVTDKTMGRDAFLTMLVSQMQNQDPLNPMDGTDFTAQLAEFSSLEQIMKVNKNIEGLQLIQTSQNNAMMTNMIGKEVEAEGNSISVSDGKVSDIAYRVEANAKAVDIFIFDSNGNVVKKMSYTNVEKGENIVSWDGQDQDGASLPDGRYSYSVAAKDSSGNEIDADTFLKGEINSISFNEDGSTSIWMGDMKIPLGQIVKISSLVD